MKSLGPTQLAILRKASGGKNIECASGGEYLAALKLSDKGLLDRDLRRGMSHRFIGNAVGEAFICEHDAELEGAA
jgi:hypothetical protein